MTQELIIHGGVDIVKLQIGPGKACKTRVVTGVGYGTLSCIDECSMAAHGLKSGERRMGLVCSDGGCKNPGDVCKGFGAGADFMMLGSMFAGTYECDGEWTYKKEPDGSFVRDTMTFYGMSSHLAQELHGNGKKNYRASEGEVFEVPYKGEVSEVIQEILGGVRSCCTYVGATCLKDMSKCTKFTRVNRIHQNYG
jgi:GMP reductase